MALSDEDFQRLQTSLLELKNQNYVLDEQFRRQKNSLEAASAKVFVLEQELGKAQKTIGKSKKAAEVQLLMKENESMQKKLNSQEEDFRHQNQTLLQELSKLVATNEQLEKRIKASQEDDDENSSSADPTSNSIMCQEELVKILESERKSNAKLLSENNMLKEKLQRMKIARSAGDSALLGGDGDRLSPEIEVSSGDTSTLSVSFRKQSTCQQLQQEEEDCVGETLDVQAVDDVTEWKMRCVSLQNQVKENQDKLKKKQDSLKQIQEEKEKLFQEMTSKFDDMKMTKDLEIKSLKEQTQRLQGQLNQGHSAFAEFRNKKAVEIKGLQDQVTDLETKLREGCFEGQEETLEKLKALESENRSLKAQCFQIHEERENLSKEVQSVLSKLNVESQEKMLLKDQLKDTQSRMEESQKTSDNRKTLLDEMAVHLQKKTDEVNEISQKSQGEIEELESKLQKNLTRLESELGKSEELSNKVEKTEELLKKSTDEVSRLQDKLEKTRDESEKKILDLEESNKEETRYLKSEHDVAIRDLKMQLEIANAQRTEFEERVAELYQEINDLGEERKISEKKIQALNKDLKRQLMSEKQRNEQLSEKLDKVLTENETLTSNLAVETIDSSAKSEGGKSSDSWSVWSGNSGLKNVTEHSGSGDATSNPPLSPPLTIENGNTLDNNAITLAKIDALQKEKFNLEQKCSMLEASATAMADDLVKKSDIIQHYCMEGKQNIRAASSTSTPDQESKGGEKLKKMIDLIKHPEQNLKNLGMNNNVNQERDIKQMQRVLEETLTKNMHLQKDLEHLSQEVVRLSKEAAMSKN